MQLPDYLTASYAFERLQPFLSTPTNWRSSPSVLVEKLVASAAFREVSEEIERRRELIWSVKYGAKPGIYTDTYVLW